ncbi:hypothetical protein FKM82_002955 [Ascaphus truei]
MSTEPDLTAGEAAPGAAHSGQLGVGLPGAPLTGTARFSEEDEDDVHKCGRCQAEFTSLEEFVHHKIQKVCQRAQDPSFSSAAATVHSQEVVPSVEDSVAVAHVIVEASSLSEDISSAPDVAVSEEIKDILDSEDHVLGSQNGEVEELEVEWQESQDDLGEDDASDIAQAKLVINQEGRWVCQLCQKTFKTANILKAHMITHSTRKDFECKLCGNAFRTKGSLIRHNRRHTDERPYICSKCGKSFRESGALTRHLKSLTPCTDKLRFSMGSDIVVSREEYSAEELISTEDPYSKLPDVTSELVSDALDVSPVIRLVMDTKGNILHEVHVQVQELAIQPRSPSEETSGTEQCAGDGELSSDSLMHHAMSNSGIVIETVTMQDLEGEEIHNGEVEFEELQSASDQETTDGKIDNGQQNFNCPQCNEVYRSGNALKIHIKGHEGCKLYSCEECGRQFLKAHLLRKHQETHFNERRYKCGECGKLYKTIAHVKGHMRVHSEDRPYPCPKCGKRYKTKNAQQVHYRTHLAEKPYACQFCSHSFREKGSLVRHVRHHTGEKPFKCYKCGRGFAEHGTLNRHLRTKGGCVLSQNTAGDTEDVEDEAHADTVTAALISEEPHTVLVEFSSVVAETQEYIIEAAAEDSETSEAAELIQGTRTPEMDSHILKVVQQIVSKASPGQQIIVRNVTLDQSNLPSMADVTAADTITIATPEALTEQVAMTLASAMEEGALLAKKTPTEGKDAAGAEDVEMEEHAGEFVITSHEGDVEVQTIIV